MADTTMTADVFFLVLLVAGAIIFLFLVVCGESSIAAAAAAALACPLLPIVLVLGHAIIRVWKLVEGLRLPRR
ncbi:hypothetical protein ACP4OV_002238 [Aristida adscensionis]